MIIIRVRIRNVERGYLGIRMVPASALVDVMHPVVSDGTSLGRCN